MRRLCIYLIYDKQKIVDNYIGYVLRELKTCVDHLVVVCNMDELIHGEDILGKNADEIFFRENKGFDAGGFKEALCNFVRWENVLKYDELILMNDSLFGPFRPMKSIFIEMETKIADFWGLAKHGKREGNGVSSFSEHIQTYFLVIRSKMLHSTYFKNYWEKMPFYLEFSDVVDQHEVKFTQYFKELGYKYNTLANTEINDSKSNSANNYMQYAKISYELIKKRNFPFLKKQQIAYNTLTEQTQENLFQSIDYIEKETNYDVDLIWENIIRTLNVADLQRSLHLQYIISDKKRKLIKKRSIAIIIFAKYKEAVEYILEYLDHLGDLKDFTYVLSERKDILEDYQKYGIKGIRLFVEQKYNIEALSSMDYVCVIHDTDVTSEIIPSCTGKSYFYCIWENLLKDKNYVLGVLEKFETEKRLGFLSPPQPNFANYFGSLGSGWNGNYKIIEKILKELKVNCMISVDNPPFRVTKDFWIRGSILKWLNKMKIEDYHYIPFLWSYFAQDAGYYSGIVESIEYASMNEVNLQYYLKQMIIQVKKEYGGFNRFTEMKEAIQLGALKLFCEKYSRVLVYGTGYYAKKYKDGLMNVEAYIVSEGRKNTEYFEGFPIMYLSEVRRLDECGIVLCLNTKNQKQVTPILKRYGIKKYFCISE